LAPQQSRAASIYSNLGTALFARKQYKDAADAFQTAMTLDPDVFEHNSTFGVLLEERNVQERAKYHYYVAKLYAKNGRNELALQYLRKALEEGFKERKQLEKDPEFAALRDTKEFQDLLALEPRVL
jgi:tetratricopeptide (TPR) repeat protein